jgi:LysM repeat protein
MAAKKSVSSAKATVPSADPSEVVETPVKAPQTAIEVETPDDLIEGVVEAPEYVPAPVSVRALAGDSYLTLAERYGVNAHVLMAHNNNTPIREGVRVFIP